MTETLLNKTPQSVNTGNDATTNTDNRELLSEYVHNTTPQPVSTVKDASTERDNRASVIEFLHNTTPPSVNTGKDATLNIDNGAPLTEYVHSTIPESVSTDKDASTITDNAALARYSLYTVTPQSVNIGKDERTNVRYPASTPYIITQQSSGDYNKTKKSNDTWTTSYLNVTHKQLILKELEAMFYDQICKTSCEDKCGQRQMIEDSRCYCDRACIQVGDCCLDYEEKCLSGPKVTRNNYGDILRLRMSPTAKCFYIPHETNYSNTLMVVTSCGEKLITTSDYYFTVDLCEKIINKIHSTTIPVVFRDIIYRNIYCAICNNPSENFTEIITATEDFICGNKTSNASDLWQYYDRHPKLYLANYNCKVKFNFSNVENFHELDYRYTCLKKNCPKILCNADVADPQFDFNYLRSTCQKYRAYIRHEPSGTEYYNPHCAMCNGHSDPYDITGCSGFDTNEPIQTTARTVMSDRWFDTFAACAGDSLYDHNTGTCVTLTCPPACPPACVTLTCPPGHVGLRDKSCARLNVTVPQMLSGKRDVRIYLVISTGNKKFGRADQQHIIKDFGVDIVVNSTRTKMCNILKMWNNWDDVNSNTTSTCWIQETLSRNFADIVSRIELSVENVMVSDSALSFYRSMQINIFLFNHDANDTSGICLQGSPKIRHDLVFLNDEIFPNTFVSKFHVISTARLYAVAETPVVISWRLKNLTNDGWFDSPTALICEPDVFSCDTVTFRADEFIDMGELLVLYGGTSQEVKIRKRNVIRVDSNAIVLCASLLSNLTGIICINKTDISVKSALTLIGNILSMACLAFTMTTYCMFEELRTRAGKCVMNLCTALFFAQLSFQVSEMFLSYGVACAAVAVFQHYTWLVAFLWINVLAFDISRSFADLKPSNRVHDITHLRGFAVYAWGLPGIFVGVCLVLAFGTKLSFSYGSKTVCWIAGDHAITYYFVTPLAVVITANAVLFVRTVVALRRAMPTTSTAQPIKQQRRTFTIYILLTSLMGFMWLFGYLAMVDVLHLLWYPFILCNTCQGVFICVSFSLTPTVRGLWIDWRNAKQGRNTYDMSNSSTGHSARRPSVIS